MNARIEGPVPHAILPAEAHALPWLVADVGGTNARFGWVDDPSATVRHVRTMPVAEHGGPAEAVAAR